MNIVIIHARNSIVKIYSFHEAKILSINTVYGLQSLQVVKSTLDMIHADEYKKKLRKL